MHTAQRGMPVSALFLLVDPTLGFVGDCHLSDIKLTPRIIIVRTDSGAGERQQPPLVDGYGKLLSLTLLFRCTSRIPSAAHVLPILCSSVWTASP